MNSSNCCSRSWRTCPNTARISVPMSVSAWSSRTRRRRMRDGRLPAMPRHHDLALRAGRARDLRESGTEVRPERDCVHSHSDMKGGVIERQATNGAEAQIRAATSARGREPPPGLTQHHAGRVPACRRASGKRQQSRRRSTPGPNPTSHTEPRSGRPIPRPVPVSESRRPPSGSRPPVPRSRGARQTDLGRPAQVQLTFARGKLWTLNCGLSQGMTELTIGELAAQTSTPTSTLRF